MSHARQRAINDVITLGWSKDGQVTVRNLADEVIVAHKRRAAARGVSLEQQLRDVLAEAARPTREELLRRLAECRSLTPPGPRILAEDLIREDRDSR